MFFILEQFNHYSYQNLCLKTNQAGGNRAKSLDRDFKHGWSHLEINFSLLVPKHNDSDFIVWGVITPIQREANQLWPNLQRDVLQPNSYINE